MEKIALFWIVLLICLSKGADAQECNVLRAGGASNWYPVSYINQKTLKAEGIAVDLVRFIGEKLAVPVSVDMETPWKRKLVNLARGDLDLSVAIYRTKEREEWYLYTSSYFVNESRVFVLKGKEFHFEQLEDLIGRIGGIPNGGSFGDEFDNFAKDKALNLQGVESKKQLIKMLLLRRTDYFIQDYLDAMMYLKLHGLQGDVVSLPTPISTVEVHFALSRKSPCAYLVPQINEIIIKAKQDGTLQSMIDKYDS